MFQNAYFGKLYKTRDGRKAIYINESAIDKGAVLIVYEDSLSTHRIMKDGHYWATPNIESGNDIVSVCQEEINEDELDKLAKDTKQYDDKDKILYKAHGEFYEAKDLDVVFKAGYRKAKEE